MSTTIQSVHQTASRSAQHRVITKDREETIDSGQMDGRLGRPRCRTATCTRPLVLLNSQCSVVHTSSSNSPIHNPSATSRSLPMSEPPSLPRDASAALIGVVEPMPPRGFEALHTVGSVHRR